MPSPTSTLTFLDGCVHVGWADVAVGDGLVRDLVRSATGRDPGPLHHACPGCGSVEHGRPYVDAPVEVSVSHARGVTLVAVSTVGRVGVDVERSAPAGWVTREAVGKAHGVGVVVEVPSEGAWVAGVPIPGYVAVVAVLRTDVPAGEEAPASRASPRRAVAETAR